MYESSIGAPVEFTGAALNDLTGKGFADPWNDYASRLMPRTLQNVIREGMRLYLSNPIYRAALDRLTRFFLTSIVVDDCDDTTKRNYLEFFNRRLKAEKMLAELGDDYAAVGNSFSSLIVPFRRYLRCTKCGSERPIDKVPGYKWENMEFRGECPDCHKKNTFKREDRTHINKTSEFKIMRWYPTHMVLRYNALTHDIEFRYRIPAEDATLIKGGDRLYLATTPWELIEAAQENALFKFEPGKVYHMKEAVLAGVRNVGWGMPRFMTAFRQAFYVQVLHRYNETLALDYIMPLRVVFPRAAGPNDPLSSLSMNMMGSNVMSIFNKGRGDPATFNFLPFPVESANLGGEGVSMATKDMMTSANEELMDGMSIPMELHRGTMQTQAAPMALRMMMKTHQHIPNEFNNWLQWCADEMAILNNWRPASVRLQPVTMADDIERKQIYLQLASARQIAMGTAYGPLGLNYEEEQYRIADEDRLNQKIQKEVEREQMAQAEIDQRLAEMKESGQAGGMPPPPGGMPPGGGGMPPGGGGMPPGGGMGGMGGQQGPIMPGDIMMQAQQMAQQLVSMPPAEAKRQLAQVKQQNELLHSQVLSEMKKLRGEAEFQGRQQLQQGGM
jgi:hypothetical protein